MDALAQDIGYVVLAVILVIGLIALAVSVMAGIGQSIGWHARRQGRKHERARAR